MFEQAHTKECRAELRAWYVAGLRPKLAAASSAGTVTQGAADALDRLVCEFLELEAEHGEEAA